VISRDIAGRQFSCDQHRGEKVCHRGFDSLADFEYFWATERFARTSMPWRPAIESSNSVLAAASLFLRSESIVTLLTMR